MELEFGIKDIREPLRPYCYFTYLGIRDSELTEFDSFPRPQVLLSLTTPGFSPQAGELLPVKLHLYNMEPVSRVQCSTSSPSYIYWLIKVGNLITLVGPTPLVGINHKISLRLHVVWFN